MRNELEHIAYVEQYLNGNLSESEKLRFEAGLLTNADFAASVEIQKAIAERLRVNAFREEINKFHALHVHTTNSRFTYKFFLNTLLLLFAAGTLSVLVYAMLQSGSEKPSTLSVNKKHGAHLNTSVALPVMSQVPAADNGTPAHTQNALPVNRKGEKRAVVETVTQQTNVDSIQAKPYADETSCAHLLPKTQSVFIDANKDAHITLRESNSTVHMPAGILVDEQGNKATGNVEIRYTEYRNAAQMAFAQLPMTYTEKSVEYNMNSVGMFEIRAYQNGKKLNVAPDKAFTVDYNITQPLDSTYFFALSDDDAQEWHKLLDISVKNKTTNNNTTGKYEGYRIQLLFQMRNKKTGYIVNNFTIDFDKKHEPIVYKTVSLDSGYKALEISTYKHDAVLRSPGFKPVRLKNIRTKNNSYLVAQGVFVPRKHWFNFNREQAKGVVKVVDEKTGLLQLPEGNTKKEKRVKENGMLWKDSTGTGIQQNSNNNYSNLVVGLKCPSFGVYNCDQTYTLPNRIAVKATYTDEQGNTIANAHILSLIDLTYNAAFRQAPTEFACNRFGRNVLLLFTRDNKVYVCDEEKIKAMKIQSQQMYTFEMRDITNTVKTPEDLKNYLGL